LVLCLNLSLPACSTVHRATCGNGTSVRGFQSIPEVNIEPLGIEIYLVLTVKWFRKLNRW